MLVSLYSLMAPGPNRHCELLPWKFDQRRAAREEHWDHNPGLRLGIRHSQYREISISLGDRGLATSWWRGVTPGIVVRASAK